MQLLLAGSLCASLGCGTPTDLTGRTGAVRLAFGADGCGLSYTGGSALDPNAIDLSCPASLLALALAAARHNVEPALQGLAIETLLLFGELDPIAGQTSQAELLHDLPRSRLEVLARAGHDLSLEQPVTTAERVLQFLRDGV